MAAISSSSEAFSPARAHCAAEESAVTISAVKEVQQKPSHHHYISGRVALFLGAPTQQKGQTGMSMLHGVLERNAAALEAVCNAIELEEICPEHIPTNEVALTQFVLKEVRSGNCERLLRCLDAGLFSVVHDVLFFQGRFREGILEQFTAQTVNELLMKSVDKEAAQLLTLLLAQDQFYDRLSDNDFRQAFLGAAGNGHLECLLIFLSQSGHLERIGNLAFGWGLMDAAQNGHHKCLQTLLGHEGLVDRISDVQLGHALNFAAHNGHHKCLQTLLEHEGLVDRISDDQLGSAFIYAVKEGHLEFLQTLLDHEGLLDRISDDDLGLALSFAVKEGHLEFLQTLLDHEGLVDRIPEYYLRRAFIDSIELGQIDSLQILLSDESVAARIPNQELVTLLKPVVAAGSREALVVAANVQALFSEDVTSSPESIYSLLHEFNLLFSTDMTHDVLTIYDGDFPIETAEQKNAFKECIKRVLVGYAREDGDSIRKQKAQQFLHSIWVRHGSPETEEGLDFAPNHMWDSLPVFAGAFLDCLME